ncbi:MAG: hypothetical protein M0D57_00840 [Sphingobacteriales bacterium JAD_PAG50586_3]|nr:MAG: hypothetical protein M0D57_00840 [Sphingobacteriales bacterium JAD_PAG50586_3]
MEKVNRLVGLITLLLHLGGACFYLIMIGQFRHHDYYIIPLLPAFLFLLITFVDLLQRLPRFNSRFVLPVALTVICSYQFTVAQANLESRYNKTSDFYGVNNDYYFELENYLQSINLQYNDAVISFADSSPNVTLYLMNRRGITFRDFDDKTAIVASMKKAKYIVNNQPSIHDHAYLQPYLQNPIGKFGIIEVYKITQP